MISLVVIIWMLMPSSASARNIRSATPVCVAMPRPTTETLATLVVAGDAFGAEFLGGFFDGLERLPADRRRGTVNEMSACAVGADVLHDHVDGDVLCGDACEKMRQARAGLVGHAARS